MCYKISTKKAEGEQVKFYSEYEKYNLSNDYYLDGFAHPDVPVITKAEPEIVQNYRWGFIPIWAKDSKVTADMSVKCLNAISEEIFEKPSFRSLVNNRCLIIVNGFYEWQHVGKEKYPYFIKLKESDLFTLGGLYNLWTDRETGKEYKTISILTTAANPLMERIHNSKKRMPLIIDKTIENLWLSEVPTSVKI